MNVGSQIVIAISSRTTAKIPHPKTQHIAVDFAMLAKLYRASRQFNDSPHGSAIFFWSFRAAVNAKITHQRNFSNGNGTEKSLSWNTHRFFRRRCSLRTIRMSSTRTYTAFKICRNFSSSSTTTSSWGSLRKSRIFWHCRSTEECS